MTEIHPTALIHPSAGIGADVFIGPYCIVHEGVQLGAGCRLLNHVTLAGPAVIGEGNTFYPFAVVGQRSQDLKYSREPTFLEIGAGNTFREFVTVNRGTAPGSVTKIGSGGNFLAYTHVAHDCVVGDHVIFSNNGTLAGHVVVEDCVVLGGFTAVHQFCRIGRHAITGGCSKVVQDVPPFMIADGNPSLLRGINQIGLERHGWAAEKVRAMKDAYKALFMRRRALEEALDEAAAILPGDADLAHLVEFIRSSQRGICRSPARGGSTKKRTAGEA